ncbi:hypothetical protein BS78_01G259500 [Paspalum vaginatum]|nr:hypothetical protein BS78_01G259500 [Paspalum vaginatum]KAJ1295912.1 hypothetical protein BS78_01G259500 [Paspalum vaginatum]KAJ1295913.1 hypothetical protein BS78_01G259500 [Paspalum vaginatum]
MVGPVGASSESRRACCRRPVGCPLCDGCCVTLLFAGGGAGAQPEDQRCLGGRRSPPPSIASRFRKSSRGRPGVQEYTPVSFARWVLSLFLVFNAIIGLLASYLCCGIESSQLLHVFFCFIFALRDWKFTSDACGVGFVAGGGRLRECREEEPSLRHLPAGMGFTWSV